MGTIVMALRNSALNSQSPPEYESDSTFISIKFIYSGYIDYDPFPHYERGRVCVFDGVDMRGLKLEDLEFMLQQVGILGNLDFYVMNFEHENRFQKIWSDKELRKLCESSLGVDKEFKVYVVLDTIDSHMSGDKTGGNEADYEKNDSDIWDWIDLEAEYNGDAIEENAKAHSQIKGETSKQEMIKKKRRSRRELDDAEMNDETSDDSMGDFVMQSESDFESVYEDEDEDEQNETSTKNVVYNAERDKKNPNLQLRMIFNNFDDCKEAIRTWNIMRGREWTFIRNDQMRVQAVCKFRDVPGCLCKWEIYARKMKNEGYVQIRTFQPRHRCKFQYNNKGVKSSWIARRYADHFRENPKTGPKEFRNTVMKENKCYITKNQGYRARSIALKMVKGSEAEQYSLLNDYIGEIQRSNPGSTAVLKLVDGYSHPLTGQGRFERMYVCFAGVRDGFLAGCRPFFGIDGTFLKGHLKGVLLTAVGVDPNNGIFPIAWAVVEGENSSSWQWFLRLLRQDLVIERNDEWTVMSDKQKGLINATDIVFAGSEHRFCVRHLHDNFSTAGHNGAILRRKLWAAAKATTLAQFEKRMEDIAGDDLEAASWLKEKEPSEWSRSHFTTQSKCDMLLNNNCECFNGKILEERRGPIVDLFEGLRLYAMRRMEENREIARVKWRNKVICPRIFKLIEKNSDMATQLIPHKSDDLCVEIWCDYGVGEKFVVDVGKCTCCCRKWQLTGIPCEHAISALWCLQLDPVDYVDECYKIGAYLQCYSPCILPLNGQTEWIKTMLPPILPPVAAKKSKGRVRNKRIKGAVELELARESKTKAHRRNGVSSCSFCSEKGHNVRSCKLKKALEACQQNGKNETDATSSQPATRQSTQTSKKRDALHLNELVTKEGAEIEQVIVQSPQSQLTPTKKTFKQTKRKKLTPKRNVSTKSTNNVTNFSAPTMDREIERIQKCRQWGLMVPPFPIGNGPKLINEKVHTCLANVVQSGVKSIVAPLVEAYNESLRDVYKKSGATLSSTNANDKGKEKVPA